MQIDNDLAFFATFLQFLQHLFGHKRQLIDIDFKLFKLRIWMILTLNLFIEHPLSISNLFQLGLVFSTSGAPLLLELLVELLDVLLVFMAELGERTILTGAGNVRQDGMANFFIFVNFSLEVSKRTFQSCQSLMEGLVVWVCDGVICGKFGQVC